MKVERNFQLVADVELLDGTVKRAAIFPPLSTLASAVAMKDMCEFQAKELDSKAIQNIEIVNTVENPISYGADGYIVCVKK